MVFGNIFQIPEGINLRSLIVLRFVSCHRMQLLYTEGYSVLGFEVTTAILDR